MDGLDESKDNPLGWIIGLLEETAQINGLELNPELAQEYLVSNWEFILACFEEEGLQPPDLTAISDEIRESWE